jgi:hypothetical protein
MKKKPLKNLQFVYLGQKLFVRPSYIVSLPVYDTPERQKTIKQLDNEKNLRNNSTSLELSYKAKKRMRNAINWLLVSAKPKKVFQKAKNREFEFKINFITLKLPDTIEPINNEIFKKKLLNPFLTLMRETYKLNNYVWKMEYQKNGKLHCHLTTDTFIHHEIIKNSWNNLLKRNGFLEDYHNKFKNLSFEQYCSISKGADKRNKADNLRAYENGVKSNWYAPNSTDIHSVKKINDLASYLCKYMVKSMIDGFLTIKEFNGRIWGCSQKLSEISKNQLDICRSETSDDMRCLMNKNINYQPMYIPDKITGVPKKWGEIFFLTYSNWVNDIKGTIKNFFDGSISFLENKKQKELRFYV